MSSMSEFPPSYDEAVGIVDDDHPISDHIDIIDDQQQHAAVDIQPPPLEDLPEEQERDPNLPPPNYRFRKPEGALNPITRSLFLVQLVLSFIFFIVYLRKAANANATPVGESYSNGIGQSGLTRLLVLSSLAAGAVSIGLLVLVRSRAETALRLSVQVTIGSLLLVGVFAFAELQIAAGIFCLITALIIWLYYRFSQRSIPVTASMLSSSLNLMNSCRSLIFAALFFAVVCFVYLSMFIILFVSVLTTANAQLSACEQTGATTTQCQQSQNYRGSLLALAVLLTFCCLWTTTTLQGAFRAATARVAAKWWWSEEMLPQDHPLHTVTNNAVVLESVKECCTSMLGSVAFGSALLAVIRTLRWFVSLFRNQSAHDNNWLVCVLTTLVSCVLSVLEDLQRTFNEFAFSYIGIYAENWSSAAQHTWDLIYSSQFLRSFPNFLVVRSLTSPLLTASIMSQSLVGFLSFLICIVSGLASALIALAYSAAHPSSLPSAGISFLCFVLGFAIASVSTSTVESIVLTTAILWAEDPRTMARRRPQEFKQLQEAQLLAQIAK